MSEAKVRFCLKLDWSHVVYISAFISDTVMHFWNHKYLHDSEIISQIVKTAKHRRLIPAKAHNLPTILLENVFRSSACPWQVPKAIALGAKYLGQHVHLLYILFSSVFDLYCNSGQRGQNLNLVEGSKKARAGPEHVIMKSSYSKPNCQNA